MFPASQQYGFEHFTSYVLVSPAEETLRCRFDGSPVAEPPQSLPLSRWFVSSVRVRRNGCGATLKESKKVLPSPSARSRAPKD